MTHRKRVIRLIDRYERVLNFCKTVGVESPGNKQKLDTLYYMMGRK